MKKIISTLALCVALSPSLYASEAKSEPYVMKVTLLGTGTPNPSPDRFGPSTLVQANGQNLLFDAGRGNTIRLWQLKVPLGKVHDVFLTHFHSDHLNGLSDLWMTGWLGPVYANRKVPLSLYGPIGTKNLASGLEQAFINNTEVRIVDENLPSEAIKINAKEFDEGEGVVYQKDGVRVTSFKNDHGAEIHPSVGYKIQYKGKSVVISGDTRKSDVVIKQATGVDLLIHEVAAARGGLVKKMPHIQPILDHHTTPIEAGEVFSAAKPKLAVYSHFVLLASKDFPRMTAKEVESMTRETYRGPLAMGEDLMSFEIGETVKIVPWIGKKSSY
jgi:ribonuclease Z